jgi:hypothetical protein
MNEEEQSDTINHCQMAKQVLQFSIKRNVLRHRRHRFFSLSLDPITMKCEGATLMRLPDCYSDVTSTVFLFSVVTRFDNELHDGKSHENKRIA